MNAIRSTIYMIPAANFVEGKCCVCEEATMLKFRDSATGAKLGHCCLADMLSADKVLSRCEVIRHPSLQESQSFINNLLD